MIYTIEAVDVSDPEVDAQLRSLFKAAFGRDEEFAPGALFARSVDMRHGTSHFLAAVEDGEIVGCGAFIPNDFAYNGVQTRAYQGCLVATHPRHKGKGIFPSIVEEAKGRFGAAGGAFLYGLGNHNSNPVVIRKCGFTEVSSVVLQIPHVPGVWRRWINSTPRPISEYEKDAYLPSEMDVLRRKEQDPNDRVLSVRHEDSVLWGKVARRDWFGLPLPYFFCGGFVLAAADHLPVLVKKVFSSTSTRYLHMVSSSENAYNGLFSGWRPTKMNNFVFYPLNGPAPELVNISLGAIDGF
jgi:predicted N-acetyltransferase YhbS